MDVSRATARYGQTHEASRERACPDVTTCVHFGCARHHGAAHRQYHRQSKCSQLDDCSGVPGRSTVDHFFPRRARWRTTARYPSKQRRSKKTVSVFNTFHATIGPIPHPDRFLRRIGLEWRFSNYAACHLDFRWRTAKRRNKKRRPRSRPRSPARRSA